MAGVRFTWHVLSVAQEWANQNWVHGFDQGTTKRNLKQHLMLSCADAATAFRLILGLIYMVLFMWHSKPSNSQLLEHSTSEILMHLANICQLCFTFLFHIVSLWLHQLRSCHFGFSLLSEMTICRMSRACRNPLSVSPAMFGVPEPSNRSRVRSNELSASASKT